MFESVIAYFVYAVVLLIPVSIYVRSQRHKAKRAREAAEKGELISEGPRAQHPHIDVSNCIGCQSCTSVCPEGSVLGMVGGKAAIVNGYKCVGHSLCAEACPVGAITMVKAHPSMSADLPYLTPEYETSVSNLFIAGELGGLALIRNAVNQGREIIDIISQRVAHARPFDPDVLDVLIVGAGPAGLSASLRAIERKLSYATIERDEVGGTVSKFPRQKLVMTAPVEFPMYGTFKKQELSKENLLAFWNTVANRADFKAFVRESVEDIQKGADGTFKVTTQRVVYRARAVVLAMGRAGTPKKLGIPGEDLPKVMYRLIEADHYRNKNILVVGGGDSAVEAAIGLARQPGNKVTISYRKNAFARIKERNATHLAEDLRGGRIRVIYDSTPLEIAEDGVILDVRGTTERLANDFVWIFAGGVPPNEFLKKIGVQLGAKDLTLEAGAEARSAVGVI
jgi:thioredoxin reductase/Pyruvate/2-oxoacid:ferredoxin oxidoreductase delta subunit